MSAVANHVMSFMKAAVTFLMVAGIRCYQALIRPFLVGACKFHPSCSEYAIEAVMRHGPWRGAWLAARRLARCRPYSLGGYDPVPQVSAPAVHQVS